METVSYEIASERPSKLVAEALVLRQNSEVVKARAQAMGLCENLTEAVVSVCCREHESAERTLLVTHS
ncbi:MAG: hypothetical protein KC435_13965 [Thermomicrobiales bacterium]|nr:hypothetical protein [Thermomicrobiales bacterium]